MFEIAAPISEPAICTLQHSDLQESGGCTSEFLFGELVLLDQAAHGAIHQKNLFLHQLPELLRRGCRVAETPHHICEQLERAK